MPNVKTITVEGSSKTSTKYGAFDVSSYTYNHVESFDGGTADEQFADALRYFSGDLKKVVSVLRNAANADAKRESYQNAGGEKLAQVRAIAKSIKTGVFAAFGVSEVNPENIKKISDLIDSQADFPLGS
jgi:hypothetical protein